MYLMTFPTSYLEDEGFCNLFNKYNVNLIIFRIYCSYIYFNKTKKYIRINGKKTDLRK